MIMYYRKWEWYNKWSARSLHRLGPVCFFCSISLKLLFEHLHFDDDDSRRRNKQRKQLETRTHSHSSGKKRASTQHSEHVVCVCVCACLYEERQTFLVMCRSLNSVWCACAHSACHICVSLVAFGVSFHARIRSLFGYLPDCRLYRQNTQENYSRVCVRVCVFV